MIEKLLAGAMALLCVVLLVRMFIGEILRRRCDRAALRAWSFTLAWFLDVWHWRASRRRAALAAEDAIRRARARMERDGNVYRPDAFREPRKPHKPH